VVAVALVSNAAYAADIQKIFYPAEDTPFNWAGVYYGIHAGVTRGKPTVKSINCDSVTNIRGEDGDFLYADDCEANATGNDGFADVNDPQSPHTAATSISSIWEVTIKSMSTRSSRTTIRVGFGADSSDSIISLAPR
jgi:hypothetical protein